MRDGHSYHCARDHPNHLVTVLHVALYLVKQAAHHPMGDALVSGAQLTRLANRVRLSRARLYRGWKAGRRKWVGDTYSMRGQ